VVRKFLKTFLSLGLILGIATGALAYKAINMRTYTLYNDNSVPAANDVQFIAFYKGDDSLIQTEDSYNNDNSNTGWYSTLGYARAQTDQLPSVTGADAYEIWITGLGKSEAGRATGTVGEINPSYTTPGTSGSKLSLSSANFLAAPSGVSVNAGNGKSLIRWNTVSGATGYRIYKRPVPSNANIIFQKVTNIGSGQTNYYLDSGLSNGTTYYYIVVATATNKMSGHSDELAVTPTPTNVPIITGPSSGTAGQSVTITGSNFGSSAGTVVFNGSNASSITSWSDTQIIATINASTPAGAGKMSVITSGSLMDSVDFTVNAPDTSKPSSSVTITNGIYGPSTWNQSNTINGTASDNVAVQYGDITIQRSSDNAYWTGSTWGAQTWLRATGTNTWTYSFAAANMANGITYTVQSKATDTSNNVQDPPYGSDSYSWDSQGPTMTFNPVNSSTNVPVSQPVVITFSEAVNTGSFTYTLAPNPGGLSVAWSAGNTVATISHNPFSTSTTYTVTVTAVQDPFGNNYSGTNSSSFTTVVIPVITGITWKVDNPDNIKNKNYVYGTIQIDGSNFGADPGNGNRDTNQNKVAISNVIVPDLNPDSGIEVYYWSNTAIVCGVPLRDESGTNYTVAGDLPVVVTAGGQASNSDKTILVRPKIYSVTPTSGPVGTNVTIEGTAFHNIAANNKVIFNGTQTTAGNITLGASKEILSVTVPAGATTGQLTVEVNGKPSNTNYDWGAQDPIIFTVPPSQGSTSFTLYQNDSGNINWVSVPYKSTGLNTTVDLGNAIAAGFTPQDGDSISISVWDPQSQTSQQTTGDYASGQFYWDPSGGQALKTGNMYKVSIYRASRQAGNTFSCNLTITGAETVSGDISFDLYHVDAGNINWISYPRFMNGLNTTVDLGSSVAAKFSPQDGDSIGVVVWDPITQTGSQTTGDYSGSQFYWDPSGGVTIEKGKPYSVSIYRANRIAGQTFKVTWP
jgi:hypothetical protein